MTQKKHPSCEIPATKTAPNISGFTASLNLNWIAKSIAPPTDYTGAIAAELNNQSSASNVLTNKYNDIKTELSGMTCPLPDVEDKDA